MICHQATRDERRPYTGLGFYYNTPSLLIQSKGGSQSSRFVRFVCLAWVISAKLNPSTGSHRQSSGASLYGENWASKLPAVIGIHLYGAALKRDISFRGMYQDLEPFLETGSAGQRPGQGRIWATTPNEDRYLVLTARRHRNMNATLFQQHLHSATGTTVSTQTVRNRLHGVSLYARRPMVCVRLASRHRRDRREWATEYVNWRRNEWSNVLFSDESHFSVHPDNRRIFIWRDRGSRNNPTFVHESVRFGGGGVLVYNGISIDERTDL
ncbi:transposable element Tcb2 transposase [Trichonephila clavipes]|nr:transposable element Tcb2 transposase [Trichonephila clavipes]